MSLAPPRKRIGSSNGVDHGISAHGMRWGCSHVTAARSAPQRMAHYPAFFDLAAAARTGFAAFFGSCARVSCFAARLPEIGSSISRWPAAALRGFLPFAFAAGADCFSLARLRFNASIRLMTLPPVFGAAFAVRLIPLRFLLIRSTSADS